MKPVLLSIALIAVGFVGGLLIRGRPLDEAGWPKSRPTVQPEGADQVKALADKIRALQSEVAELRSRNLALENRIAEDSKDHKDSPESPYSLERVRRELVKALTTNLDLKGKDVREIAESVGNGSGRFPYYAAWLAEDDFLRFIDANIDWRFAQIERTTGIRMPSEYQEALRDAYKKGWRRLRAWRRTDYLDAVQRATTMEELSKLKREYSDRVAELQGQLLHMAQTSIRKYPELRDLEDRIVLYLN